LPGIESDQPVMPSALEKIKAFRQGTNTDGSPILIEPFEQ
jgi:hypothetical protein